MPRRKQHQPKRMKLEEAHYERNDESTTLVPSNVLKIVSNQEMNKKTGVQRYSDPDLGFTPYTEPTAVETTDEETLRFSVERTSMIRICERKKTESCNNTSEELNYSLMAEESPLDFSLRREALPKPRVNNRFSRSIENGHSSETQDAPLDLSVSRRKVVNNNCPIRTKVKCTEVNSTNPNDAWTETSAEVIVHDVSFHFNTFELDGKLSTSKLSNFSNSPSKSVSKSDLTSPCSSMQYPGVQNQPLSTNIRSSTTLEEINSVVQVSSKTDGYRQRTRQNPWQSQWISKSGEQTKDVFTCVWCKDSFQSLSDMTLHMKNSSRCGMAGIQDPCLSPTTPSSSVSPIHGTKGSTSIGSRNFLVKESMTLPRKLVRGQDIWLGKGAEQTKEILKCMWCGQSFKSLADMTTHMRITQHYINIISQDQLVSWKSTEDKAVSHSNLNAVLTCKVCDHTFGSLKELSYHIVKNSHYKEHILRSITEGRGRRRQTKERRKKSLPVRKLLELERMELHTSARVKGQDNDTFSKIKPIQGRVSCEECGEKVDAKDFISHIKSCSQSSKTQDIGITQSNNTSEYESPGSLQIDQTAVFVPSSSPDQVKSDMPRIKKTADITKESLNEQVEVIDKRGGLTGCSSVLNKIEKLIEKSFEDKSKNNNFSCTGILQRLGIDEDIYPPWHSLGISTKPKNSKYVTENIRSLTSSAGLEKGQSTTPDPISTEEEASLSGNTRLEETYLLAFREKSPHSPPCSKTSANNQESWSYSLAVDTFNSKTVCYQLENDDFTSNTKSISAKSPKISPYASLTVPNPAESDVDSGSPLACDSFSDCKEPFSETAGSSCVTDVRSASSVCSMPISVSSKPSISEHKDSEVLNSEKIHPTTVRDSEVLNSENRHPTTVRDSELLNSEKIHPTTVEGTGSSSKKNPPFISSESPPLELNHKKEKRHEEVLEHPLKELQKLLDKTNVRVTKPNHEMSQGSILEFSWACNEAAASDSLKKCAFCDTHFISKGAYRHHLSKAHFVKDGYDSSWSLKDFHEPPALVKESTQSTEESPHYKFIKYTELAKELSSKYV